MESIKRFFRDETATAEATSTVLMIAAAGILLAGGLAAWYLGVSGAFTTAGNTAKGWTADMVTTIGS